MRVPALGPLCPHLHSAPGCTAVTSIRLAARDSRGTRAAQLGTGSLQGPVAVPGQVTGRPGQPPGTATSSVPGGLQVGAEGCFLRATQHPMGHWGSDCFHHPFQACTPAGSRESVVEDTDRVAWIKLVPCCVAFGGPCPLCASVASSVIKN